MRKAINYTIMDRIGTLTDTFVGNATTDLLTSSSAHGLKVGDMIVLTEDNTLPTPLAESTVYHVVEVPSTTTLKISTTSHGPAINITSTTTNTDTWTMHDIGRNILVEDFRHAIVSLDGLSSNNCTVKFVGSIGKSPSDDGCPDFSASKAWNNSWDTIEIIDYQTGNSINGDTGVAQAGTNDHRLFELNINGLRWVNVIITAWSAGNVTIKIRLFND